MDSDKPPKRGPRPWVTDEELTQIVRDQTADRPVTTATNVAEATVLTYQTILDRLHDLEDEGHVESLSTGNGIVWWADEQSDNELDNQAEQ